MFHKLPPAGNRILVSSGGSCQALTQNWSPFAVHWYGSGTSALAAAVSAAVLRKRVPAPEVLVPAYTCPDVISAIMFAGAKPVLVDLAAQRPWLDLDAVDRCANRNTVAIVAINFLGIRERIATLRAKAAASDAVLIEDSAQSFPLNAQDIGESSGDLMVLSFGRGKPVSLLGGGAVLARDPALSRLLPQRTVDNDVRARVSFRLRIAVYNLLRRPSVYWLLDAVPFLGLGRTVFKPLPAIEPPTSSLDSLGTNIDAYRQGGRAQRYLRTMVADRKLRGLVDLAAVCRVDVTTRLLRYPLLLDNAASDYVHTALQRAGLGSSRFYQQTLPMVPGIPESVRAQGEFPNAARFAASLITLPTHDGVTERHIARTVAIIEAEMSRASGL